MSDSSDWPNEAVQTSPPTSSLTDNEIATIADDFENTDFAPKRIAGIKTTRRSEP